MSTTQHFGLLLVFFLSHLGPCQVLGASIARGKTLTLIDRTFVVIGPTGSGKSTLINHLLFEDSNDFMAAVGASPESNTLVSKTYKVQHQMDNYIMNLKLVDTVGLDAADQTSEALFANLTKHLHRSVHEVHGFILVHKMERFRAGVAKELKKVMKMFELHEFEPKSVLLVITHSSLYKDSIQEEYKQQLCSLLSWLTNCEEHAIHANFLSSVESREEFHDFFLGLWQATRDNILETFKHDDFDSPFIPFPYHDKEFMSRLQNKSNEFYKTLRDEL